MSQWTSWKQQQTLEEMRRLKQSTSATVTPILKKTTTLDSQTIQNKNNSLLSKLESRKAKSQGQTMHTETNLQHSRHDENQPIDAINIQEIVRERDTLLEEKQVWLNKISDDNKTMASVLTVRILTSIFRLF